ncbi:MAG: hypothetical protein IPJ88_01085 [Myxococcales bacterium]|nr:MAG: hypothetical protein IPJ88_01085 [Myxococcales bacterium]
MQKPAAKVSMSANVSPLLGYNTNARHRGKVYHIQTEDSGVKRPHVITHLFADGGRIIASVKTSYAEHVGTEGYRDVVKKLMQEQHKAMFVSLRDGQYDEQLGLAPAASASLTPRSASKAVEKRPAQPLPEKGEWHEDTGAFAEKLIGRYQGSRSVRQSSMPERPRSISSMFHDKARLGEKSLDEVILGYLAEEWDEDDL